jgi:hypothetical protein
MRRRTFPRAREGENGRAARVTPQSLRRPAQRRFRLAARDTETLRPSDDNSSAVVFSPGISKRIAGSLWHRKLATMIPLVLLPPEKMGYHFVSAGDLQSD